jgi:hypothetical protein
MNHETCGTFRWGYNLNFFMSKIARTIAILFLLITSQGAKADEKASRILEGKARHCIAWLVDGAPYVRTANAILAGPSFVETPEQRYPLPYILTNLGLARWIPEAWSKTAKIHSKPRLVYSGGQSEAASRSDLEVPLMSEGTPGLSLGEGRSGLLPFALSSGIQMVGVDLLNGMSGANNGDYLSRFFNQTSGQDATDLSNFADKSQSLVVSHMLLPHFTRKQRIQALRESFRVLQNTGTARHSILIPDVTAVLGESAQLFEQFENLLVDAVKQLVAEALGDQNYQLAVFVDEPRMRLTQIPEVELSALVDTDVSTIGSYDELRKQASGAEKRALNLLIVLRRPEDSIFSWAVWFGLGS